MIGPFRYGYHMVTSGTSLHDECLLALKLVQRFSDQDHLSLEVLHVRAARGLVRATIPRKTSPPPWIDPTTAGSRLAGTASRSWAALGPITR